MAIKAVIFDMDGVIINSEHLWDRGLSELMSRYGAVYDEETKILCMGRSLEESSEVMKKMHNIDIGTTTFVQEQIAIVIALYDKELDFMPGFMSLNDSLRLRNVKTCIATSSEEILMKAVDSKLDLTRLFYGNVVFRQPPLRSNPAPDLFLAAASKLGVKPEECVVIEDSPFGVEAALNAGMKVIAVTSSTHAKHLTKADLIVDSLEEINHNVIGVLGLI